LHHFAAVMSCARYSMQTMLWLASGAGLDVGPYHLSVGPFASATVATAFSTGLCAPAAPTPTSVATASEAAHDEILLCCLIVPAPC
jgi:hypothetical protein